MSITLAIADTAALLQERDELVSDLYTDSLQRPWLIYAALFLASIVVITGGLVLIGGVTLFKTVIIAIALVALTWVLLIERQTRAKLRVRRGLIDQIDKEILARR